MGVVTGGLAAAGVALLVSGGETAAPRTVTEVRQTGPATQAPTLAGLTPFDRQLLPHVPDGLRAGCRHETPLTADFDATLSCRPGEPVSSLTYSHARSGFLLYDYFLSHVREAGLPDTQPLTTGLCGAGDIPSVNHVAPRGLSGRVEMSQGVKREERLGSVLCQRPGEQFRIEWITNEVAVYAMATGTDLQALYDWWSRDGGPEP